MDKFADKMRSDGLNDAAVAAFKHNYEQLVAGVEYFACTCKLSMPK
jgi:hypothetical protein